VLEIGGVGMNRPSIVIRAASLALEPAPRLGYGSWRLTPGEGQSGFSSFRRGYSAPQHASIPSSRPGPWLDTARHGRRSLRCGAYWAGRQLCSSHGQAPDERVRWWQDRLKPVWKCCSGGCTLIADLRAMIEGAGFAIDRSDRANHGAEADDRSCRRQAPGDLIVWRAGRNRRARQPAPRPPNAEGARPAAATGHIKPVRKARHAVTRSDQRSLHGGPGHSAARNGSFLSISQEQVKVAIRSMETHRIRRYLWSALLVGPSRRGRRSGTMVVTTSK